MNVLWLYWATHVERCLSRREFILLNSILGCWAYLACMCSEQFKINLIIFTFSTMRVCLTVSPFNCFIFVRVWSLRCAALLFECVQTWATNEKTISPIRTINHSARMPLPVTTILLFLPAASNYVNLAEINIKGVQTHHLPHDERKIVFFFVSEKKTSIGPSEKQQTHMDRMVERENGSKRVDIFQISKFYRKWEPSENVEMM